MRKPAVILGVPALLFAGFVACTSLVATPRQPANTGADQGLCLPTLTGSAGQTGPQQASAITLEQRGIADRIIQIGQSRRIPPRAWQVAIQAGKTESNLANLTHGDRDSLGIFQMRPSMGWGTVQQVTNVDYQINTFYDRLLQIPGWEQLRPGEAAQKVERSAFPMRYHKAEPLAAALLAGAGAGDPSGCADMAAHAAGAQPVLDFAAQQLGKPYAWGAEGPNSWDCSSLTQAAYRTGGVSLPRVSHQQYNAGQHVPVSHAQPGDLVFWATNRKPELIHHVGIYVGGNEVLHAPQPGEPVERTTMWDGGELVPTVTRPAGQAGAA